MKSLLEIVREAKKNKVAVGHFNISNLEMLKAVSHVARRLDLPVVVGVSEGEREGLGVHHAYDLVESYNREHAGGEHILFLNADHTHSLEKLEEAARVGYDSVVFDGSKLPFEENIKRTKEAVKIAKKIKKEMVVEGELGYIGSGSVVFKELPAGAAIKKEDLTRPEDAARFVKETGVDMLAPAVGNVHGMFEDAPNPKLDIERVKQIREAAGVPLTLHGGSGISDSDFIEAIKAGIALVHISTEVRVAWRRGIEEALRANPGEVASYKIMPGVLEKMEKVIEGRLRLFNGK